jgi:flagellar basal-body rod modification protein FlgD
MSVTSTSALQAVDADSFLKLFVTQLQHQDPMSPLDASQMLGELAQLTSVQKMTEMSETFQAAYQTEQLGLAKGLIGSQVGYYVDGEPLTGVVEGAAVYEDQTGVIVNGTFIDLDAIQEIRAQSGDAAASA